MQQNSIFTEQTFNCLAKHAKYKHRTPLSKNNRKKLKISVNIRENLRLGK